MREKVFAIVLLLSLIIGISGLLWIYWYKYRPAEIEELCTEEAKVNARGRPSDDAFHRRIRSYQECLQEEGGK
ncbi:MAG: hypothetical protein ABSB95_13320 [Dissulfurispiraceae bacterium]|jgi:hypothetical protein